MMWRCLRYFRSSRRLINPWKTQLSTTTPGTDHSSDDGLSPPGMRPGGSSSDETRDEAQLSVYRRRLVVVTVAWLHESQGFTYGGAGVSASSCGATAFNSE